jgi:ketosteroid isomerase-like protein
MIPRLFAFFALSLFAASISPGSIALDLSAEEQEVWRAEEDYWKYVKARDLESYLSLWHEDFVGWPSDALAPVRKDRIGDWIQAPDNTLTSYELRVAAVQLFGNIAVTHYSVSSNWSHESREPDSSVIKITHTWMKDGERWLIIGGMVAPLGSVSTPCS